MRRLILEARTRAGGRNWSLRGGDEIRETASVQRVAWDAGAHLYFNPGPARLPYHHEGILSYCRELGVPLEVMSNDNRGALLHDDAAFDGKPQRNRQVVNDIRGYIAELAAKAVDQDALTQAVTHRGQGAHPRLAAQLRRARSRPDVQGLRPRRLYASRQAAAPRQGTAQPAARPARDPRLPASGSSRRNFGEGWHQAATMMQPVGGMGRIGQAFGRRLGASDHLRRRGDGTAPQRRSGARIVWRDTKTGASTRSRRRWSWSPSRCRCCARSPPISPPRSRAAIEAVDYVPAVKIAFQAERRFWELDQAIYGGISWTTRDITQVWYPSAGIHQQKGILVGAYIWYRRPRRQIRRHAAGAAPGGTRWRTASACIRTIAGI